MEVRKLFTINTRTINGNIVISTVQVATLDEAITTVSERVPGMRKSCFVNITPEQAESVKPIVESRGRRLYPTKGSGFLLGLPKRDPVTAEELAGAFS